MPTPSVRNGSDTVSVILQAGGIALAGYLILFTLLTSIGALSGSTRLISVAGLGWWSGCLLAYLAAGAARGVWQFFHRHLEDFASWLKNVEESGQMQAGFASAIGVLAWVAGGIAYFLSELCYVAMGAAGTSARLLTDLHLWLHRGGFDEARTALWNALSHPGIATILALVPLMIGLLAQAVSKAKEGFTGEHWVVRGVKIMTSLELARGVLLLATGLWGPTAFVAADQLFSGPAELLPFVGLSASSREPAATFYKTLGPTTVGVLLVAVPIVVIFAFLFRGAMRDRSSVLGLAGAFGEVKPHANVFTICLTLIATAMAGSYWSNDMRFAWDGFWARDPIDRQMFSCIRPIRFEPVDHVTPCFAVAQAAWWSRLDGAMERLEKALPRKEFTALKGSQDQYRNRARAEFDEARRQSQSDPDRLSQLDQLQVIQLRRRWQALQGTYSLEMP